MDELLETVHRLVDRVERLEQRLAALEGQSHPAVLPPSRTELPAKEELLGTELALPQPAGIFPVIGKAMLGIAGAYLLRAVSESGAIPQPVVVAIALVYAGTWLVWATRARVSDRFVSIAYATTAALILAPMLAELTLRFHILPASATAALLIAFLLSSAFLAWKRDLTPVVWVGVATAVCTSFGLVVISRDMAPYLWVLLTCALMSEVAAVRGRWRSLRALVAPAADVGIWALIDVFSVSESSRQDYVPVATPVLLAAPLLLFLIYGVSVAFRSIQTRERITVFEVIQATVSFSLCGLSCFWFARQSGMTFFGAACWFLAAWCYGAALLSFNRAAMRNYRVYTVWSAALVLAGSFLVLSPQLASLLLSGMAVVMAVVGARAQRLMPAYQALVYLAAAALVSGLIRYEGSCLIGALPGWPAWTVWVVAVCAIACYAIAGYLPNELWNQRLLRTLLALLAVSAVVAFFIFGFVRLSTAVTLPTESYVAVVRTLVVAVFAVAIAFAGRRYQRIESLWSAYCALAFLTAKLVFEDLRTSHSGSIAISIFLYAVALIIIPRLARAARQLKGAAATDRRRPLMNGIEPEDGATSKLVVEKSG